MRLAQIDSLSAVTEYLWLVFFLPPRQCCSRNCLKEQLTASCFCGGTAVYCRLLASNLLLCSLQSRFGKAPAPCQAVMQRAMAFAQVEVPREEKQRLEASIMEGLGAFRRVLQVWGWHKCMHPVSLLALLCWRTSWPANACYMSKAAMQQDFFV